MHLIHFTSKCMATFIACCLLVRLAPAAEFSCVIQPRQVLEIRSPVEGLIEQIVVERGDRVRKGQEIAFVDTSVERVLAESAKFRSQMEGTSLLHK
jgi:multidrug efflux pump subunit AcrA (membrane-fusion protein)